MYYSYERIKISRKPPSSFVADNLSDYDIKFRDYIDEQGLAADCTFADFLQVRNNFTLLHFEEALNEYTHKLINK